ncbi:MAG: hypothetical protein GX540_03580 [Clostridiales bacterium]|nr:hypothetical protein [Clostridiales bacterium]
MKKAIGLLLAALLFLAALTPLQAEAPTPISGQLRSLNINPKAPIITIPDVPVFTLQPTVAPTLIPLPTIIVIPSLIPLPTKTPAPSFIPVPTKIVIPSLIPIPTSTLAPTLIPLPTAPLPTFVPLPTTPPPAATNTPKPTQGPQPPKSEGGKGLEVTSFGLYFEELRPRITEQWYMFTPLDLTAEGVFSYPLVAGNALIVGNLVVTVAGGQLIVLYQAAPGVVTTREFFTLFPSLDAVQTVEIQLLSGQALPFGQPISIQDTFGDDRKVILYLNNIVDHDAASGLAAFNPDQFREQMQALLPLLD